LKELRLDGDRSETRVRVTIPKASPEIRTCGTRRDDGEGAALLDFAFADHFGLYD
jgi:hypothetical protein